jgi:hypothetical protein
MNIITEVPYKTYEVLNPRSRLIKLFNNWNIHFYHFYHFLYTSLYKINYIKQYQALISHL